jgi:hypothetical protein
VTNSARRKNFRTDTLGTRPLELGNLSSGTFLKAGFFQFQHQNYGNFSNLLQRKVLECSTKSVKTYYHKLLDVPQKNALEASQHEEHKVLLLDKH